MSRHQTPETNTKQAVKAFLKLNQVWTFPCTAGLGSYPGCPDRLGIFKGLPLAIEVKSPTGRLTAHQEAFRDNWIREGGLYLVVRSLEDLATALGITGIGFN
jgi:hypothetical protein